MAKVDAIICTFVALFLATMLYLRMPPFDGGYVKDFCNVEYAGNVAKVNQCMLAYKQSHKE